MSEHFSKGRSTSLLLASFDITYTIRNTIRTVFAACICLLLRHITLFPSTPELCRTLLLQEGKTLQPQVSKRSFPTQLCSSALPTSPSKALHLSSPHLSPGIRFFPDTLCYPEIADSVNAELLSSNYNTQNIVSLWDSRCKGRERSAALSAVPCSVPSEAAGLDFSLPQLS